MNSLEDKRQVKYIKHFQDIKGSNAKPRITAWIWGLALTKDMLAFGLIIECERPGFGLFLVFIASQRICWRYNSY